MLKQKYVVVTGGELFNKGAQAMTYITVDQIAKKYPDCKVILFSDGDFKRPDAEKAKYKFEFLPFPGLGETISLCTGLFKKRYLNRANGKNYAKYKEIVENTVALLDISGYALGSKWSDFVIEGYLRKLFLAKHFGIPVYLMPQSFGPFDFKSKKAKLFHKLLKHYLSTAKLIMARENDGLYALKEKYKLKNVIKTPDLVLQNTGINPENIFYDIPEKKEYLIEKNSVALIPNSKNNKFGNEENLLNMYRNMIDILLEKGTNIYLIYHAVEDLKICRLIKDTYYAKVQNVYLIEDELNCIEFDDIVQKFDFIIGSRYHSIVHAYRKAVPAIVIGWAVKYKELAHLFEQEKYCFNVENAESYNSAVLMVKQMYENHSEESKKIFVGVTEIQKENVYDLIEIKSR